MGRLAPIMKVKRMIARDEKGKKERLKKDA